MEPLEFNINIGKKKPENIRNVEADCPFCHRESLVHILAEDGDIMWLMNKYPVLKDAWQTVIIEGTECYSDFAQFSLDKATHLLEVALKWWQETIATGKYQSVIYFKNHGPMSGGSIRHPHSQIIGFEHHDYRQYIKKAHFEGHHIFHGEHVDINISSQPLIGFYEFNFICHRQISRRELADYLQSVLSYVMRYICRFTESYNLFFYDLGEDEHFYVKVVPRYMTTPLFVGYGFSVVTNEERTKEVIEGVRQFLHTRK